jgi:hypothetical protein
MIKVWNFYVIFLIKDYVFSFTILFFEKRMKIKIFIKIVKFMVSKMPRYYNNK